MTKIFRNNKALISIILIFLSAKSLSNPIPVKFLSELKVDKNSWVLELHNQLEEYDLTGWFLTSQSDTAYFRDSINLLFDDYLIITPDSLKDSLFIDPSGDIITLHDPEGFDLDWLSYGDSISSIYVSPLPNQSICWNWDGIFYYLDNTPTLGAPNDSLNAKGYLNGIVTDTLGIPLSGVNLNFMVTDSTGLFSWYGWAKTTFFVFQKENYKKEYRQCMIFPDSTIFITVVMEEVVQSINNLTEHIPTQFKLSTNYPNPFNSSTSFTYQIPIDTYVEIVIYNSIGQLMTKLFSGFQAPGLYRVNWNSQYLASGVYIFQLKTHEKVISRKCLLIK